MDSSSAQLLETRSLPDALARSLRRVLKEQARAKDSLAPQTVHDLRVALRRSRVLAEGFARVDMHGDWRRMRKVARRLQQGLAGLRDVQVMAAWARRLGLKHGPAGAKLAASLRSDERKARRAARAALDDFPRKRWKRWRRRLPLRAARIAAGPRSLFPAVALQELAQAKELEGRWRKSRSRVSAHRFRIGVKHLRYTVENLLPELHAAWRRDLKRIQHILGEIHDLDVLHARVLQFAHQESVPRETLDSWLSEIDRAREERVGRYRNAVARRTAGNSRGRIHHQTTALWEKWGKDIELLVAINPLKRVTLSGSEAKPAGPRREKSASGQGRRRRLSSAR
jgi:CHAD domain-containing protein